MRESRTGVHLVSENVQPRYKGIQQMSTPTFMWLHIAYHVTEKLCFASTALGQLRFGWVELVREDSDLGQNFKGNTLILRDLLPFCQPSIPLQLFHFVTPSPLSMLPPNCVHVSCSDNTVRQHCTGVLFRRHCKAYLKCTEM